MVFEIGFATNELAEKQFEKFKNNSQGIIRIESKGSLVFNLLNLIDIPMFLNIYLEKQGWNTEIGGFLKGPIFEERFDEPNLDVHENNIEIYDNFNRTKEIVSKKYFYYMALEFAHKALEAVTWFDLLEKGIVDKKWVSEVKQWIINNEDTILKMQDDGNV